MPLKNVLRQFQVITSGDMSQTSVTSSVTSIQFLDNIGYQIVFTGSPTGTFSVEVSADYVQVAPTETVTNTGTWTEVTLPTTPVAAGSAGNVYIDLNQLSAPFIRLKYTKTSGTGTVNAYITGKAV